MYVCDFYLKPQADIYSSIYISLNSHLLSKKLHTEDNMSIDHWVKPFLGDIMFVTALNFEVNIQLIFSLNLPLGLQLTIIFIINY